MSRKLLELPRLVDRALWTEAQLSGVAFLTPKDAPPGLGLVLAGARAGLAIFDAWRRDLGARDEHELLRVAIVEGAIPGKPAGYTLTVGLDVGAVGAMLIADPKLGGVSHDVAAPAAVGRRMTTPKSGSAHLHAWKALFAAAGVYALVPVVDEGRGWEPYYGRMLCKRRLYLRRADEIHGDDPDAFILH
jgi:hypothetical protein